MSYDVSLKWKGREIEGKWTRRAALLVALFLAAVTMIIVALVMVVLLPIALIVGPVRELVKGNGGRSGVGSP